MYSSANGATGNFTNLLEDIHVCNEYLLVIRSIDSTRASILQPCQTADVQSA